MGTVRIEMDQQLADKLMEMIQDRRHDVRSGTVTGFDWDQETELALLDDLETAVSDGLTDLANGVRA